MIAAVVREAAQRDIGNIATVKAAAESLPFDSGHFDAVVSRFSAHHWGDLTGGLREAARVLKAGGQALFVDGRSPGLPLLDTHLQAIELLRDPRSEEHTSELQPLMRNSYAVFRLNNTNTTITTYPAFNQLTHIPLLTHSPSHIYLLIP